MDRGCRGVVDKSKERIIGRKTRDSDHGDVDGSSRLDDEGVLVGVVSDEGQRD